MDKNDSPGDTYEGNSECVDAINCTSPTTPTRDGAQWRKSPVTWSLAAAVLLLSTSQWWMPKALVLTDQFGLSHGDEFNSFVRVQSRQPGRRAFDLSSVIVPQEEIRGGGPPKDGIPALSTPKLTNARDASYLQPSDRVIGFVRGQEARAYPLKILNYHEIVNDRVDDVPIAVTYCPLCDSVAIFDRRTELGEREFGVSGLLYNSNVLMYDRGGKESLWSQIQAEGISGPGAKRSLKSLPVELTTWRDWVARYPDTKVLSSQTGHVRDYQRSPYGGYFEQPGLMFPVNRTDDRLPAKQRVLGAWSEGVARAYPVSAFGTKPQRIEDRLGDKRIVIEFDPQTQSLRVAEADEGVEWMYSLWFAWYAFRPETDILALDD